MTVIAWLFPGQGAQTVGMGEELFEGSAAARAIFERADAALGWSVSQLCFEGPPEALQLTANTQPALVTVSMAALAALREAFPTLAEPAFVAGHSLGEYSALVAADALALEDAVRLVHLRGRAMQEAVPAGVGTMAAVMADAEAVTEICAAAAADEVLAPANFNAPGRWSSPPRRCRRAGHRTRPGAQDQGDAAEGERPLHCSLMRPAAERMRAALAEVDLKSPRWPVVANVTGEPVTEPHRIRELLVQQVDGPCAGNSRCDGWPTRGHPGARDRVRPHPGRLGQAHRPTHLGPERGGRRGAGGGAAFLAP
jgi:[acyl-carrier-protein] S-malonyltransferase